MPRLAIISLGALGGALLEACARRPFFDSIVVATRDTAHAMAKANNARIGAALEGVFPDISVVSFDMHAPDAPLRLRDLQADVVFAAPSMMPWWRIGQLSGTRRDAVEARGLSAFDLVDLPRAAMLLAQGAGRLIRHEEDRGVVAVLDRRLVSRRYGLRIIRTLPGFRRTTDRRRALNELSDMVGAG